MFSAYAKKRKSLSFTYYFSIILVRIEEKNPVIPKIDCLIVYYIDEAPWQFGLANIQKITENY